MVDDIYDNLGKQALTRTSRENIVDVLHALISTELRAAPRFTLLIRVAKLVARSSQEAYDQFITFIKGDASGVAKALRDHAKENPLLVLKGGVIGGKTVSAADVKALADLPSREVLLAQIAGMLQAPLNKTANLLQAPMRKAAYGLKALIESKGENEPLLRKMAGEAFPGKFGVFYKTTKPTKKPAKTNPKSCIGRDCRRSLCQNKRFVCSTYMSNRNKGFSQG